MKIKKTIASVPKAVKRSLSAGKNQVGKSLRSQDRLMGRPQKATIRQAISDPVRFAGAFAYGAAKGLRRKI